MTSSNASTLHGEAKGRGYTNICASQPATHTVTLAFLIELISLE
jgi:hypothetical protein